LISSQSAAAGIRSSDLDTASHGLLATNPPRVVELGGAGSVTGKIKISDNKASLMSEILFIT
jgi:hypothetical protein